MSAEINQWIMDTMISMTLLMAFVLIIRKPVSHFFGAKIAYALWALPVARLFMPVLTLEAPAPVEAVEATVSGTAPLTDLVFVAPTEQVAAGALASIDWFVIALIVWAGGAGMLFISKLASYVQFREDIVSDGQLVGRHDNIRILETAAVGGPLAFGLFQKYIAVPTDFYRNYSPRERELALEHEIAHHESGDLMMNFAGLLVLSLHWFNPVAWFAWVAFREDQETACDARILQNSGQEVRAIYGRTIAKSASGHKLGLASPLNQKDKIKGRLKMLGKGETSGFRKKLGIMMVGASTIVALPATATVVYSEADLVEELSPAGNDGKLEISNATNSAVDKIVAGQMSVPAVPAALAWPEPPAISGEDEVINITMLNGSKDFANDKQYVHRIRHDGRTIILRTNKKLSDAEVREKVAEAEESRLEADADLREYERETRVNQREIEWEVEKAKNEALEATGAGWHRGPNGKLHSHGTKREIEAQMRKAEREAERAMRESQREVERSVQEAKRDARAAAIEARRSSITSQRRSSRTNRQTSRVWSIANQVAEISFAPRPPRAPSPARAANARTSHRINCTAMNKQLAFGGRKDGMTDQAWAVVAGCGTFEVNIDEKQLMEITLRGLERDRLEAAKCKDKGKLKTKELRAYDRDIQKLKSRLSMT